MWSCEIFLALAGNITLKKDSGEELGLYLELVLFSEIGRNMELGRSITCRTRIILGTCKKLQRNIELWEASRIQMSKLVFTLELWRKCKETGTVSMKTLRTRWVLDRCWEGTFRELMKDVRRNWRKYLGSNWEGILKEPGEILEGS